MDSGTTRKKVLIAGAGASGLAAALFAARAGASVAVVEAGKQPGRKILASGNGRCNVSNSRLDAGRYHGACEFAAKVLDTFGWPQTREFFLGLGVPLREEDCGRVFPGCGRSRAVLDALSLAVLEAGGRIVTAAALSEVRAEAGRLACRIGGRDELYDRVVLACGSCAYPQLGGTTSGYELAKRMGHAVTKLSMAQVPLCVKEKSMRRLKGIRVEAEVSAEQGGGKIAVARGELLFTEYGLSGPCALDLSRSALLALENGPVSLSLNLLPEAGAAPEGYFVARAALFPNRKVKEFLSGLFHESIINLVCDRLGSLSEKTLSAFSRQDISTLAGALCAWRLELTGGLSWKEAMVCAGGVDCRQVDSASMASRIVPGVYFCGELLDVDGDCGGFNLQFAWASGRLAGLSAAR